MTSSGAFPFRLLSFARAFSDIHTPVIRRRNAGTCVVEYVIRGRGFVEIGGHSYHAQTGSVYFLHKGSTHKYWPDPAAPWEKLFFVADGPLMEELFRAYRLSDVYYIPSASGLLPYFETILRFNPWAPCFHEHAAVIFHQFAAACSELLYHPDERTNRCPEKMRDLKITLDRSSEQHFVLEDYCRDAGLSTAYAIRSFRRTYGITPKEYLLSLRLVKAKQLLLYSQLSIKEIASALNFFDQYHFSHFFRTRTGFAPTAFRKNGRDADLSESGKNHIGGLKSAEGEAIISPGTGFPATEGVFKPCSDY